LILSEFVRGRDVRINAVSNYISRNPELFEGHIRREGKNTILDDEAVSILEKKYPMPKPVILVEGVPEEEHREVLGKLSKAQELIISLQNQLTDQKLLNAEHEYNMKLLEEKQSRADEMVAELKAELEKEKSKTWWQKLRKG